MSNSTTQRFKKLFREQSAETVVQAIDYTTIKHKEVDIYIGKREPNSEDRQDRRQNMLLKHF